MCLTISCQPKSIGSSTKGVWLEVIVTIASKIGLFHLWRGRKQPTFLGVIIHLLSTCLTSQYYSQDEEKHDSNIGFWVGCQNPMQWFLSSFQSPYVYIYIYIYVYLLIFIYIYIFFFGIYICIHIFYMYQTSTFICSPIFLGKKHPFGCQSKKTFFPKTLQSTWTISSTWSWPCFSRDVGCRITSNHQASTRLWSYHSSTNAPFGTTYHSIPPETKQGVFIRLVHIIQDL